jgi:hypothetical protein
MRGLFDRDLNAIQLMLTDVLSRIGSELRFVIKIAA